MSEPVAETFSDGSINDIEAAKLLLDEWKFRQQHAWSLLPRYGLGAIAVSIVPYVKIDPFKQFSIPMLIFPIIGWLFALAATWLITAEYFRAHSVLQNYRKLIGPEKTRRPNKTLLEQFLNRAKVRWATPVIFLSSFTVLTILNIWILSKR